MKKLSILILFLFCAIISFAQFPNNQSTSDTNTLFHYKGGLTSRWLVLPVVDTLNNKAQTYFGALTVRPQDASLTSPPIYMSIVSRWIPIGSAINRNDTLFAQLPAFFDSTSRPGSTILKILQGNGIVSGGTVTVDSCSSLYIPATVVIIGYTTYTTATATRLIVPANGSGNPRTDEVIDSLGYIILRIDVPSRTPVPMPYNAATEFVLGTYTMPAGVTCVGINQLIVHDENGYPEWAVNTFGTITMDSTNTDKPFHLTKAIYVNTYTNGSQLIFTAPSPVTVSQSEVFSFWVYLNGAFGSNQFTVNFLNGSTPVGNPVSFNSGYGFNPNDSNFYQLVAMQGSVFGLTNQTITTVVITFSGNDLSGAKGLYLDWLQLQNGAANFNNGHGVFNFVFNGTKDTLILTRDDGRVFYVPITSGSIGNTIYSGDGVIGNGTPITARVVYIPNDGS